MLITVPCSSISTLKMSRPICSVDYKLLSVLKPMAQGKLCLHVGAPSPHLFEQALAVYIFYTRTHYIWFSTTLDDIFVHFLLIKIPFLCVKNCGSDSSTHSRWSQAPISRKCLSWERRWVIRSQKVCEPVTNIPVMKFDCGLTKNEIRFAIQSGSPVGVFSGMPISYERIRHCHNTSIFAWRKIIPFLFLPFDRSLIQRCH